MDDAVVQRIDTLHRNAMLMPRLTLLGMLMPFILMIGAPLGLMYAVWRSK